MVPPVSRPASSLAVFVVVAMVLVVLAVLVVLVTVVLVVVVVVVWWSWSSLWSWYVPGGVLHCVTNYVGIGVY